MNIIRQIIISLLVVGFASSPSFAGSENEKPNISTLLSGQLGRVEGTEFIMSRVHLPPNRALPKHWHPGEEFVYVVSGRVTLWQEGKETMVFSAGDAAQVPLEQIHTAITGDEGVDLIVFRVHEKGKPERILAKGSKTN